jgi:hypothetical protein
MTCPFRLVELEIFLKWKMLGTVTWVTSMHFETLAFIPDVDFAVLIITDKIHLYIPTICNLYSMEIYIQWKFIINRNACS